MKWTIVLASFAAFLFSDFNSSEAQAFGHHRRRAKKVACQPVQVQTCCQTEYYGDAGSSTQYGQYYSQGGASMDVPSSNQWSNTGNPGVYDANPVYSGNSNVQRYSSGQQNQRATGNSNAQRYSNGQQNQRTTNGTIDAEAAAGGQDVDSRPRAQGAASLPGQ